MIGLRKKRTGHGCKKRGCDDPARKPIAMRGAGLTLVFRMTGGSEKWSEWLLCEKHHDEMRVWLTTESNKILR